MHARDIALAVLNNLDKKPGLADVLIERAFDEHHLNPRDRAFVIALVQGTLRWRLRFDWIIAQAVRFPFRKIESAILNILRMALCQVFFMDRVPESAVVNEAVKQAKVTGRGHTAGFVNGILRHVTRNKNQIQFPGRDDDPAQYLSVVNSYPLWLVNKWAREFQLDRAVRIMEAQNHIPDMVVRTNTLAVDRQGLIQMLKEEGVDATPTPYSPEGIRLCGLKGAVTELKAFEMGMFQVQGEAAQICSHLLFPGKGEKVADMCAGLGGKSSHMAALMEDKGIIVSVDISGHRLRRLSDNSRRLGVGCIRAVVADAGAGMYFRSSFDKIMVDGPCSGLGVISRHPDIKWARDEADITRLAMLQKKILNHAGRLLRKGGYMLYVTCTLSREENEEVAGAFLDANRGMVQVDLRSHAPEFARNLIDGQGFFKAIPDTDGMDGFFAALFKRED
ncbi:Ribosomal RNA small subunit methyltransferase B [uncultured Desulfobacterium sp.]|uniref:16S rRNA (cytosine(967)-C(5))-methyltransferase n=1 Tax=uncultured Desulfobacterium sp. TaxID=201089 RepID=A0A445N377_9BACT|nr:Ribosomal RNA small subunit methyltransferase B [uncultured Desulfobacterium sp.]